MTHTLLERERAREGETASASVNRHSTASVLTATTLAYAAEAGVTAAAGTRLSLQSVLVAEP